MERSLPELGLHERRLLLNCARLRLEGSLRESTEALLAKSLAWSAIVAHAELHSVAPLLHHHLKPYHTSKLIPQETQRQLLLLTHRAEYQNRQFSKALQEILNEFAEADIPVLVLKGLSLVELIYGNLSLRPLIDLNLLVPREKHGMAHALLSRMGYLDRISAPLRGFYSWCYKQSLLVNQQPFEVNVLLQWDVVNRPRLHAIDLDRLWGEAQTVRLAGCDTLIPSPVDFVLYMGLQPHFHGYLNTPGLHAMKDPAKFIFTPWTENRLIRFTDLYEAIRYHQQVMDWTVLVDRATSSGLQEPVFTNLSWVTKLLGPVVDPGVLTGLIPTRTRGIRRWMFKALESELQEQERRSAVREVFRTWWLKRPTFTRLLWIRFLDLLEYIFPRYSDVKIRNGFHSRKPNWIAYLWHTTSSLSQCGFAFLLIVCYRLFKRRQVGAVSTKTPSREMSHP